MCLILVQVDSLKMIVSNSAILSQCRSSFLKAVGSAVGLTNEQTSSHENVTERIADLKVGQLLRLVHNNVIMM